MKTMRDAFITTTANLIDEDRRVALVLADISAGSFSPSPRIYNIGIREQSLIGITAGLALSGMRPIAHTYAPFLVERPFEQIKLDFGHQDLGAILVSIGASFDASSEGRTHQAPGDIALLATLPGWTIYVPGHPDEAEVMLREAAKNNDRVYVRLAADSNAAPLPVTGELTTIREGTATGVTVLAVGPLLDTVAEATTGLDVNLLYANTVRPFDRGGLATLASAGDVILVEPYLEGTSAGEVTAALMHRPIRLLSIGVHNTELRHYGTRHQHATAHGLDVRSLRAAISRFLDPD